MRPIFRIIALLLVSFGLYDANIEFTYSTMYDIYDIQDAKEIHLPRCHAGCLIFASAFGIYENNMDPYHRNLFIKDSMRGVIQSISELLNHFHPDTSEKLPLDLPRKGNYSIVNLNEPEAVRSHAPGDITVWVIERAKAKEIDYEIYDAAKMNRLPSSPSSVITIMSSDSFVVDAEKGWGEVNSYTVRLVGFDNAFDDNEDLCDSVFETPTGSMFDGFNFYLRPSIVSFVFANSSKINLTAKYNCCSHAHSLSSPGFITSPGYIGCSRLGDQAYRSTMYWNGETIVLHGQPHYYEVSIDSYLHLAPGNIIEVEDLTSSGTISIGGFGMHYPVTLPRTQSVIIAYDNATAPQSFLLRYTTSRIEQVATPGHTTGPAIASTALTTKTNPTEKSGPSSTTAHTTTTTNTGGAWKALPALAVMCSTLLAL